MRPQKKIQMTIKLKILILILFSLTIPGQGETGEDILLKLPVRVFSSGTRGGNYIKNLGAENFELRINGKNQKIMEFKTETRSLANKQTQRMIALSFDGGEYDTDLPGVIGAFVRNEMTGLDFLAVRTPLGIYKLEAGGNKNEFVKKIETNLKKDLEEWNNREKEAGDMLVQLLKNMELFVKSKRSAKGGTKPVILFMNNFSAEWQKYRRDYYFSHLNDFIAIASEFVGAGKEKGGEKWLIHFPKEKKSLQQVPGEFQQLKPKIKEYLDAVPKKFRNEVPPIIENLDNMEKSLLTAEVVPVDEVLDSLLGVNIGFDVVVSNKDIRMRTGVDEILEIISFRTGGIWVNAVNVKEGLEKIAVHTDEYYELVFKFDGVADDKTMEVRIPGHDGAGIFYKKFFKREEFKWLEDWLKERGGPGTNTSSSAITSTSETIRVSDFSLEGHGLKFTLSGFRVNEGAVLNVTIRLVNDAQEVVFEAKNTISPSKSSLGVSLGLPVKYTGYFKLAIEVRDAISGQSGESIQYVKLPTT